MPHCIIEHSSTIKPDQLNNKVFLGALNSGLFEADGRDIKVRSVAYEHYQTGTTKEDFIHVTLRILSGRSDANKATLSNTVMTQLESLSLVDASITIEVVDMDRSSYSKVIV
ncbi:5-carboxymethyl-2-hydroxymuconate Delta-isomerase [Vibrio pomeroyi]|uniref:5-carboxymethyl-2-hydroxymuconate Delta-isomerase n=1 Tax=Vibrio pomeroyi TaxID=198832 RepID=A0ABV4MUX7_9VIBR|nr:MULTISPECIES: 5-carboxymethyl-2-hydroxymuconate Delta-isomerase [unclassified Vibrio]UPR56519.1 5-carboxymethyl-2-hydroxymuconate Delta-isomerase [Vibrio sp. ED004]UPR56599.1 5-carboxymethyl-2-hydroxymuconate Delta-isomerase [Vibrio sp. ED004]